jgi:hypothetical protein
VGRSHVPAINPHRHGAIRHGQFGRHFRFDRIGRPFFAQLRLHPLGDGLKMFSHHLLMGGLADRQHFLQ